MGRLADFDLKDSSPSTSPHAQGGEDPGEPGGDGHEAKRTEVTRPPTARELPAPRLGSGLPDPAAEPVEQLATCERAIHDAKAKWIAATEKATAEFVSEAGPYLAWVHEHRLHKLMKSDSGKPYRSFEKYAQERHGISKSSAYRITREMPLLDVLEGSDHPVATLSVRQVEKLHPLRRQHGDEAVQNTWDTAWSTKKKDQPTPDEIGRAILLLGYEMNPDADDEPEAKKALVNVAADVQRARRILVPEVLRQAVKEQPDEVVFLARALNEALDEAGISLK